MCETNKSYVSEIRTRVIKSKFLYWHKKYVYFKKCLVQLSVNV